MVKYVGYYDTADNAVECRIFALSAISKIDYIVSVLNKIGLPVQLVSASCTRNRRGYKGKLVSLGSRNTLRLFRTIPAGSRASRFLSRIYSPIALFVWLLLNTKKHDNVLVYHSVAYASCIAAAKWLIGFRLSMEVEEVYADVTGSHRDRRIEDRAFARADAFILPTELLNQAVNRHLKPHAVVHGAYQDEPPRGVSFNDGRIHVVYAGTFDPRKGGALAAAAAAQYLDDRFHVHIIGFGTKSDTEALLRLVAEVSAKSRCRLTYDGLLAGDDYVRFLQSCDIGLSTQRSDAAFNETSFPSKVLSYLANGLRVVSIRLKALEESGVSDLLYYYDSDDPAALAATIQGVDISAPYDSRARIRQLDCEFRNALGELLDCSTRSDVGERPQEVGTAR